MRKGYYCSLGFKVSGREEGTQPRMEGRSGSCDRARTFPRTHRCAGGSGGGGAPQGRPPAEAQKTERRQQRRDCDLVGEAPQCWWLLLHLLPPWATETQDESRGSRPRWWVHRPGSGSGSGSEGTDLTQCPSFPHLVNGFNNTNN